MFVVPKHLTMLVVLITKSSFFSFIAESLECPKGDNYLCKNSHRCIPKDFLCDGMNDCWNTFSGADEYFCCKFLFPTHTSIGYTFNMVRPSEKMIARG